MTAKDANAAPSPKDVKWANKAQYRSVKVLACLAIPLAIWLAPLPIPPEAKATFAISAFMIISWMTEIMDYSAAGLLGLLLFWGFSVAEPEIIFSGFVSESTWFYLGAVLIGAMATKSGIPQRVGNFVILRIGLTYSRFLLGLIVINFLLTFLVPSGAVVLIVTASIALGVLKLFKAERGSNMGRGVFLVITYMSGLFNKMVIAGTATILARGLIVDSGTVVPYSLWVFAFLPCALISIFASWRITLKLFPPETESIVGSEEEMKTHFGNKAAWTPLTTKASLLIALALGLWMTDWLHGFSPALIAFAVGLFALLPYINVLDEEDFKRVNLLPFFFVGAALGMSAVLKSSGALEVLTDVAIGGLEPMLSQEFVAITALYWGGFIYHLFTGSEISMLVTSLPLLLEYANANDMDPRWIGMIWAFSSGGKLFAYESAVLVLGYSYGFFQHTDLIKLGALLAIVEFVALAFSVVFYWPLLGLNY